MERSATLARTIVWKSSRQSFLTAILLADRELADHCLRAYAYFRWLDDCVDLILPTEAERWAFIQRQQSIISSLVAGHRPSDLVPEEEMLADLIANPHGLQPGLRSYLDHFLSVIAFDARRRGQRVSQQELEEYSSSLASAVMDGLQYFIGNGHAYPLSPERKSAVVGAHITHMLRDLREDMADGIINVPLESFGWQADIHVESEPFRMWVKERVGLARSYFREGKEYIESLDVFRCQLAGIWYCARFENILDMMEHDQYVLRADYQSARSRLAGLQFIVLAIQTFVRFCSRRLLFLFFRLKSNKREWSKWKSGMSGIQSMHNT